MTDKKVINRRCLTFFCLFFFLSPLCFANDANQSLARFGERVMLDFYHFNYQQAATWPQPMRAYFSEQALHELSGSIKKGLLHDVSVRHLSLTSKRIEPIEIYHEANGHWQIKSIIQVTYASPAHTFRRDLLINLRLVKGGKYGWLVDQLLARPNRCVKPSQSWL